MSFSRNLNRLMEARGWRPVQLAAALTAEGAECAPSTVERWMNGDNEPRASMVHFIAKAFEVTPNDLFADDSEPAPTAAEG